MGYSGLLFSLFWFFLTYLTVGQLDTLMYFCVNNNGNYTADSTYWTNLQSLLLSLSSGIGNDYGFYNRSAGQNTDRVNAIALCQGDINSYACLSCINVAASKLIDLCPNQKEAIIWYYNCMFRYSNRIILHKNEGNPSFSMWNKKNVTDWGGFRQSLKTLLDSLRSRAAAGGSLRKFAAANQTASAFQTIFALVQCTPDLSEIDCNDCLDRRFSDIPGFCNGNQGCRGIAPSCNFRYEINPFYDPAGNTPPATPPSPPVSPLLPSNETKLVQEGRKGSRGTWIVLGASFSTILGIALFGSCIFFLCRQKKLTKDQEYSQEVQLLDLGEESFAHATSNGRPEGEDTEKSQELPFMRLNIINEATKSFSEENKLGEGGFGPVYKGTLTNGKEIAVKRLSRSSGQGLTEFKNEVTLIAKLQHRNLVRLLGCCLEKKEKLLVYEYMPKKSLDFFLFDPSMGVELNWERRLTIIDGIARGLMYLHQDSRLRVIHRDLKASNVLLDDEWNPKISDFGMARIFGGNQCEANTNRVVGTYGYMAPEYAMEGLFSVKSDVFSFGVLLLEIISGKKNNRFHLSEHGESLLTFAWKQWCKGEGLQLMDPLLAPSCVAAQVLKCVHIGLLCVQEDPADRPTMSSVVVMLASETITLPRPTQPAFSVGRVVPVQIQSTSDGNICSVNEATLSNLSPR